MVTSMQTRGQTESIRIAPLSPTMTLETNIPKTLPARICELQFLGSHWDKKGKSKMKEAGVQCPVTGGAP